MIPLNSHKRRALKRGKLKPQAEIDLHGMRRHEARDACDAFLTDAIARGLSAVKVITGKSGVLRQDFPRWLEAPEFRPHLLSIEEAQPRDGGSGAFVVLLRRQKSTESEADA